MQVVCFGASFLLLVMFSKYSDSASVSSEDTEIFSLLTKIVNKKTACEASLSAQKEEINDLKRSKAACEARIDGDEMKGQIQIFI